MPTPACGESEVPCTWDWLAGRPAPSWAPASELLLQRLVPPPLLPCTLHSSTSIWSLPAPGAFLTRCTCGHEAREKWRCVVRPVIGQRRCPSQPKVLDLTDQPSWQQKVQQHGAAASSYANRPNRHGMLTSPGCQQHVPASD